MIVDQQVLNRKADIIESVLERHRLAGEVTGGEVDSSCITFHLAAQVGTRVSDVSTLAEKIALAIGVESATIYRRGSEISIKVPKPNRPAEAPPNVPELISTEELKRLMRMPGIVVRRSKIKEGDLGVFLDQVLIGRTRLRRIELVQDKQAESETIAEEIALTLTSPLYSAEEISASKVGAAELYEWIGAFGWGWDDDAAEWVFNG